MQLLQHLPFEHYRVELSFDNEKWEGVLFTKIRETQALGTKLELVLFFTEEYERQLENFANAIKEHHLHISSILALHVDKTTTPVHLLQEINRKLRKLFPGIEIGYGTDGFFADLNRNRPLGDDFDFVSFPLCPQVHASDTRSVLENLERQTDLITTARSFSNGKKIHVSPITFKIRTRADHNNHLPTDYDSRQHNSFGALWTLACIKNLAEADRLTLYQVKGYRGILHTSELSPVYIMLKAIKAFNPKWMIVRDNEQSFLMGKIALENEKGERLEFDTNSGNVATKAFR